jgi:choline dehydrogenase-like flavoprotein
MTPARARRRRFDVIIIGSGVGGSMTARALVHAGLSVLMIERGPRVERGPANWSPDAALELSPYYTLAGHYRVRGDDPSLSGTFQCVGGPAVFFGAVSYRMRECDFDACAEIVGDAGSAWPYGYADLEPYYGRAERVLGVAGCPNADPLDPPRSAPYPFVAPGVQGPAKLIWETASALGLTPTRLPLAIDFTGADGRACARCGTCDGYVCAVAAKRDPAVAIRALERRGMTLLADTIAVRLLRRGGRVTGVIAVDRRTGRRGVLEAERYVLAAGAIGSPHLIIASGLHSSSPAREHVGRYLMRHCNGIVFGLFPARLEGARQFHKQVGIMDFYGGTDARPRLGCIQSIHPPPTGLMRAHLPSRFGHIADAIADHATGLLVIAEDQPRRENRVSVHPTQLDEHGLPRAVVTHRYTWRDLMARRDLTSVAHGVLRQAGAAYTQSIRIKTFSHAVGTLRMGLDPHTSPLDHTSRFRGVENLWVTDGSFMPRSAAVNPSLTIGANALMAAEHIGEMSSQAADASSPWSKVRAHRDSTLTINRERS